MSATESDIESSGGKYSRRHNRRRRRRLNRSPVLACGGGETTDGGSLCFSDSDSDDDQSWHSTLGVSHDECGSSGIEGHSRPESSRSGSESEVDLESGELVGKVHFGEDVRDCRICHLDMAGGGRGDSDQEDNGGGGAIELGCDCKGDLGAAHKQCAETWFKIKGNTTCEICGTTALNVAGEHINDARNVTAPATSTTAAPMGFSEHRSFWQGRRIMNFLLGCMIFAFLISWLFHFRVLP